MASSHITSDLINNLMDKVRPGITVSSFKVETGSRRGDNYTAMLFRVVINLTDGSEESLIIKCLPDSIVRRQAFKSDVLFQNEVAFYTQALPALLSFQEENCKGGIKFSSVPKCHLAQDDLIVLEDLKARGFDMPDRKTGLNLDQCTMVLRILARFHALSFAMKYREPEKFQHLVKESVNEVYFTLDNEDWYRDYYRTATRNALTMVKEKLTGIEMADYIEKFKSFVDGDSVFRSMVEMVKPREPLAVLCHGDCWSNNIMFKYNNSGYIQEVCLVDFQVARYGSPALDIVNLLYCCTSHELRTSFMAQLTEDYYSTLCVTLDQLGCPENLVFCKEKPLKEMLLKEIHRCGRYGLGLAIDMIPICTCDSEEAPDLYEAQTQEESAEPVSSFNEQCQQKMSELVQELIDNGDL
ncbi:uncharacterized protein LOC142324499 [Lycorma delicatula]|uniref:uncharacterized protein LOC142324499 n=1 Tax=Lycorma delicatula TaxID=130591 RepID=UPI003F517149